MADTKIKFSVVTVCLNAEDTIDNTIESVRMQTYPNYEYIIWDGKSIDSTLDKVYKSIDMLHTKVYSEKDSGLYNAMNQATQKCDGEYLLFLNSGDTFADEKVLQDVADFIESDQRKADIYFGNVIRKRREGEVVETYHGRDIVLRLLLVGRMPCHQSIFTRTAVMKEYGFDESYSITADYNFLMKCRRYHKKIQYIDRIISRFDCIQGISSEIDNLEKMRQQDDRSMKELYPGWYYILKPIKAVGRRIKNMKEKC